MFDPKKIRADFPILSRKVNGQLLTYLDSAATSQKPEPVLRAMDEFYREHNANPHRGVHALSGEATEAYESARRDIARFFGASKSQLVFTRSATEAINLFVRGWVKPKSVVLLTEMEHHANLVPWYLRDDLETQFVGVTEQGLLDVDDFRKKVDGADVVSLTLASNVLGTINPVSELAGVAHAAGAKVLIDAAQAAPHLSIDFETLGADAIAVTGHKMLGPTGIGALIATEEVLSDMQPVYGGGEMIKKVELGSFEPAGPPWKLEAGTMPAAEAVGWSAALRYLGELGMEDVRRHEVELSEYALEKLSAISGLTVLGPTEPQARVGLVAFTVDGVHPHDLATLLDEDGIAIRSGHHCAQPLHDKLGIAASSRVSFSVFTTKDDIDQLVESVDRAKKVFSA